MNKITAIRMLSMCHDPNQSEKDLRRSHAVAETRLLKQLLHDNHISIERYRTHLRELSEFIIELDGEPEFNAPFSSERTEITRLDTILLDYLIDYDGDDEHEQKRMLGS